MWKYAAGHLFVLVSVYAWNVPSWTPLLRPPAGLFFSLAATLCFLPLACACLPAVLVDYWRPRAMFDPHVKPLLAPLAAGLGSGCLAVALTSAAFVVFRSEAGDDAVFMAGSAAISSTCVVLLFSRTRQPGRCARCNYDISHSLDFGRCPECGTALSNL